MADTSYFDLYKALKADGAVQGDWNSFHKFVGAPGKQGYLNRKKLYDALKADGAVQSSTYEEFNNRLFRGGQASLRAAQHRQQGAQPVRQVAQPQQKPMLGATRTQAQAHARNNNGSQGGAATQQPQTAAQRAMQMVGGGTDYMKNWQLLHKRNDQMTPTERMQANTARSRMQQAQKLSYQQEQGQKNANPISQSKVNPHAQSFNETMQTLSSNEAKRARAAQQRQDDATNAAEYEVSENQFSHDNGTFGAVAPQIDAMVAPSMTEADDLSWKNYQFALKKAGNDAYLRNKAWKDLQDNRIRNRQEVLAKNLGSKLTEIYSDKGMQRHIMESADKLNMGVEEYVDKYVTPQIMNRAQSVLGIKNIEEVMPKSAMEYVVRRLGDSILGTLSAGQDKSKEQIAREQEAMAISDDLQEMPTVKGYDGEDVYRSGVGGRFVSTAAKMMMDSPILGMTGGGANLTVDLGKQVLTRGLAKVGLAKAGAQLSAKQLGFKIANMSMAQKVGSGLMEGTAKGALNLGGYSAITSALGQASTGKDTSMAALAEAGLEGFKHGATTGAMFGASGAVMSPWISKFGIDGTETTRGQRWLHGAQKVGAEAVGLGAEAGTMMVADNVTGDKDISVGQWLEDVVMVGAFKAGEPSNYGKISQALYHLTHNTSGRYTFGKDSDGKWRTVDIKLTDAEKGELINSTSGKNLMDAFSKVDKTSLEGKDNIDKNITKLAYKEFMADPTVSQSTKEKVNAAMGLFNTDRKVSQRSVNDVQNKQILEYADDGTLLTRTSYKNAEQRRAILFKQKVERADMRMMNLIGYGKLKGRVILDSNDQITPAAASFLNKHGYDLSKEPTDANNAQLISDIKDKGSKLYAEWVKFADEESQKNMLLGKYILDILSKDPMKRTDEEMRDLNVYYKDLKDVLFPEGKPNVEQSTVNGQEVAEENNLGTEQPNNQAVLDNLHGLTEAENEMEQLMNSNDIFSDNFKELQKQGLTHPQIYDWLIQNGMTEEQLAPYAHYMNAVAKVQGMQNATAQAIEEHVGAMAQDWGFHGKMNGVDADGSQVLYVQDRDGRMLIVGSGEVAYDATDGHAKDGVGDMLVCLDPNTRETVYVRAEDTTLFQTQDVEDFKNDERQRLQSINSVPYNQAAQEQAAAEAAKPQPKEEAQQEEKTSASGKTTDTSTISSGGDTALSQTESVDKGTENIPNDNNDESALTFKDGSAVPVDANGEPDFMQMTPEQGVEVYKQLFPKTYESEVDNTVKMLEADLKKVQKATPKAKGLTARAKEQAEIEKAVSLAEEQLARAKEIKKAIESEKIGENIAVGTEENVSRYSKEREQGYRIGEGGVRYDRQKKEDVGGVEGKEVEVAFSPTVKVKGHAKLVELDTVQASHNNGQINMMHFGSDWQPKDRTSKASRVEAEKIAANIDPKQITGSENAFIGSAPSVNERHETIQGNNRVEALKQMYSSHPEQAAMYKQWLMDHADDFGLSAEDVAGMKKPVIVNELPVDDAMAKKLGQMAASGFESGGSRIPDVSATINKIGGEMQSFANELLAVREGMSEETSLGEFINSNAERTLEWLYKKRFIDNTEYENLYKDADKRRDWLNSVLKTSLFDGDRKVEAAFNNLPAKAKRAVLATFLRDMKSGDSDKIKTNIKHSFEAFNDLESSNKSFKNAKNLDDARRAVQAEVLNGSNSVFGDTPIREKYTNFELELAALYKGIDQKTLTSLFNRFYDEVQGTSSLELHEQGKVPKPLSKDEAIEKVFETNNYLANDRRRETEPSATGGRGNGAEPEAQGGNGEETERKSSVSHGGEEVLRRGDAGETETSESERVHLEELGRTFKLGEGLRHNAGSGEGETPESEGAKLEAYAKESGIWRDDVKDYIENEIGATYLGQGGESYVYEKDDAIYKDRPLNFNTIHESIDNFLIAHELSPESGYEIVAVGPKDKMGQYHVVLRQKKYAMDLEHPITDVEIDKWFADRGFKKSIDEFGNAEYRKGDILVTDGIDSNFARDPETGKIVPIDLQCFREAKVGKNTRTTSYGDPEKREAFKEALRDGLPQRDIDNTSYEFSFKDAVNESGILDDASVNAMWKKEVETIKKEIADEEAEQDKVNSSLADRIKETEEESEVDGKNGTTYRKTYLLDGKKVIQVDEPNEKGEYTGSYFEYDGKRFGDLQEVADYIDGKTKEDKIKILPEEDNATDDPTNPFETIAKAADDFKKEHPMSEEEIMAVDGLDDEAKYTAIDYLNGEDDSEIARICYEQAYAKRTTKSGENVPPSKENRTTSEEKVTTSTTNPIETIEKAAADYESEKNKPEPTAPKTAAEKKAAAKKLKKESDKKTQELMNQFLAAKDEKKDGSGKLYSLPFPVPSKALKWMDRNLTLTDKQKEILPKLLSAIKGSMYARIKEGIYNLEDVIENVRKDFKAFFDALDKDDANKILAEAAYKGRFTDPETGERIRLAEAAERERKLSPEHQEKLVGDSKDAEDKKRKERSFINRIQTALTFGKFKSGIVGLRKIAEDCGLKDIKDTDLQELVETAVVMRARDIAASKAISDEVKFKQIKRLYENQPSLNQRDSERIKKQQYSTPAPYAFVADMYVKGGKEIGSALEPSAGNGMLTIGLPMDKVHVNDIDEARLLNLHRQGFKTITSQDGTQPFADKNVDVVVTNPPFGSVTPKDYNGYRISSLEGQMAINALESMKDDGRAAIIIGGKSEYAKNGSLMPKDKAFLGYLYSHYNVEDVINVDGSLYAKQGTSYPTRIILINGRRLDENAFPPVKDKARAETVKDYDELYKRVSDDILRGRGVDSSIRDKAGKVEPEHDRQGSDDTDAKGVRTDGYRRGEPKPKVVSSGVSEESSMPESNDAVEGERGAEREPEGELPDGNLGADRTGTEPTQSERAAADTHEGNGGQQPEPRGTGRKDAQRNADEHSNTRSGGRLAVNKKEETKRDLSSEKVTYTPKSGNPFTLQSVMPADQQEAVNKNLAKLGDADQFLVEELGYNDKDDLYKHLAAEQVDSVTLAIHQAKQGNAFIIGDMTGIGKGRQAASLIRYAKKQGQIPVYFTKTAGLLSDVYRDLVDIGSPDLKPFVFGSSKEAAITDSEGNVKFALPTKNEVKRVLDYIEKNGKLPKEYDYVLTTYSQVGNGIYEYGEDGSRKEKKLAKGKAFGSAAFSGQRRRDAIEKLMDNGYLILDESHTAGGDSGQGNYFQHIIQKAKNVTFFSATFAKRPDNMPIYALRTAMNQGGLKASELIDAVKRGGATLQEIMSQTLTQCGQMVRRERDMTGVTIDWKAIDDPEKVEEQRAQYDSIIGLFNDIINFQRTYVSDYVENRNKELAAVQASMGIKKGTAALGIKNTPFASKAFNTVQQVLLSLKAKSAAERAVEYLKQGMKPVIALNNTNESQTGNIAIGEEMDAPDLGTSLKKGLEGTLRYTQKDAKNNSDSGYIKLSDLGDEAVAAYHELEKKIEQTSTGLSLSPIDVIKNELQKAGYKVGELTGRQTEFVYNDNGTVTKVKRADTDKKKLAREFNDGQIDALILNKSAATGISLHASSKFKDQRKRVMIVAQQQLDVNDEVQMRGRIDRTGQILRGAYEYVVSLIPAEQRLLMMFKAKLKSLDANTTSSQKSKFNEMEVADITNKYGDKVVREYMAEHLDLYARMADPFGWEQAYGDDLAFIDPQKLSTTGGGIHSGEAGADASKLLGRMALLKVAEQEKMLQEIGDLYAAEINRLNEMGENDLEITELPLKAKTIGKEVWKQGTEPDGDNAFADNTYIEKVNMAILKKPMKAEEVQKAQEGLTGGRSWDEYRDEKKQTVKAYFDEKIADATQKNEERAVKLATHAKEKYLKDAKRGQKDSGMSDEQMAGYQYDNIYKAEKEKLGAVVKNLKSKAETFGRVLDTFNTEDAYVLPADMNNPNEMSAFGNSYGRLIDIKITDNFSPNASSVSFATLDGRRKITFPISGKVGAGENKADVIAAIDRMTKQASGMGDKNLRVLSMDTANWNRLVSNESRKDGYIITGNLMQALIDTKEQGVGGQLVKYTTDTGEVKTGILMPDRFEPNDVSVSAPISSVEGKFHKRLDEGGIESVKSTDGDVEIIQKFNPMKGDFDYQIRVPKSQKRGGKYFLDKELMSMMGGGNFETRGNSMLGEFKENDLRPVLARLSNLGVKVKEERQAAEEDGTHFRSDSVARVADDAPVVVKHVDSISKKLGAKANMVQSAEDVTNKSAKAAIERGEKITGWYDEKTGEVHLYMPNIHDRYTAEKTIWHEVVGHKGMRELFGDENYSKFLRSIWYDLDKPENAWLKELVSEELKYNPFDFENGIEEGIARLVEDGKGEPGFWNAIKNKVTDILHEIGYRIAPNTKDVKYLLWLGKNLQKNPNDPYWKMKAEAVRYKLDKENVPAMIEKDGVFYTNDGKARSFNDLTKKEFDEATDGVIHLRTTPSAGTALDRYHKALDAHGYMFTESYMDNMLSLKNLMQAIVPDNKNIADIKSSENPYILQNTMQGAMSNAAQMFERNVMKPLDKAMAEVLDAFEGKKDDEKIRNFNLYMITKHGLERNRILYMRDTLADMRKDEKNNNDVDVLEKDWYDELANLDERLNRGDIDLKGYFDGIDDFIRTEVDDKFDAGKHDYSGIHAIQGIEKSSDPYDDAEAIASVMDAEANMESIKKGSVKAYWDKVKAATQYAIDTDYKNGLISKELHGYVSGMFNWYVPLRKYDEATAEDAYGYITEKGDPKNFIGSSIMRARGHKYLSETNVLAQIGAMGNRAINNGGQNAIKQAFARFIRNHSNNNLVTETSVWYMDDPVTMTTKERYPEIPEDATPDEVNQIVADFNSEMRELESKGLATKVRRRGRIGYKFERAENKSQHIVDVMIAGKKHSFIINGNPRAAQALNGLLENSKASGIMKPLGSISRMMAQLCTSYNPEFVMRNIMRDAEFASSNVTAKEGARYGGIWAKYYAQLGLYKGASTVNWKDLSGTTGLGLFAKYRNGTLDMNDKVQRYFKEFMENGGETGWVQIKNMKEWEQQYKSDVKNERSKVQKGGAAVRDFFFGNLENLNEVAENIARFSTYCASRDFGRTVVRSTYDAKEVSVNFNRHGSGDAIKSFKNGEMSTGKAVERWAYGFTASYLRHCSMFFNAGIQSTNLLVKNLKTNPVGTSINMLSIPFALGALAALGNNALIASEDEKDRKGVKDPYGELPDYIRRNNLCIYKGGGEFITIPLAIELRAFYGLGDLAAGMTFSPNVSGQKNPFFDAVGSMSQLVPVMDYLGNSSAGKDPIGETIKAISPSAISPFVEWEMNSDWKGSPIERRGDWNENNPAWQRAYNGTPEVLKNINKKVNAATNDVANGNEDMLGNGFLDMVTNPSMLNHFFGGVGGGAATFGERLLGAIKHGKDTETKDVPFVRSLLYTPSEQTSLQRTKSKWYNYVDEMETTMANLDRLKSKNVPIDKRLMNIADYYHFQNSSDAAKVRVIELAQKQMKQWKKMRDRATDTQSVNFANQNIDRIMMEAVDDLDRME